MYRVFFLDEAHLDISRAKLYYESVGKRLSKRFESELKKTVKKLRENPLIFGYRYDSVRVANLDIFPYQLHYDIEQNRVLVYAVVFASQNTGIVKKRKA